MTQISISPSSGTLIRAVSVPLPLDMNSSYPTLNVPLHFTVSFKKQSASLSEAIIWALKNGHVVDLEADIGDADADAEWEALEDLLEKSLRPTEDRTGKLVLCEYYLIYRLNYLLNLR